MLPLLLVSLAAAPAQDLLDVQGTENSSWYALVTGFSGGKCESRLIRGPDSPPNNPAPVALPLNFTKPPAGSGCDERVVLFTEDHGIGVVEEPKFTNGLDTISISPGRRRPVEVKFWILDCFNEDGLCNTPAKNNIVKTDAVLDFRFAKWTFQLSRTGIDLRLKGTEVDFPRTKQELDRAAQAEAISELTGSGFAEKIHKLVPPAVDADGDEEQEIDCGKIAAVLNDSPDFFVGSAINVYYVRASRQVARFCEAAPSFVLIPVGAPVDLLAHELGHALGLPHPGDLHPGVRNLMVPGDSLNRCSFNLGQIQDMHNLGKCSGKCREELLKDRQDCPQLSYRVILDWIRCLHCLEAKPPKVNGGSPLEIIDVIGMALAGLLRVEDRMAIDATVKSTAKNLEGRGLKLPEDFPSVYRNYLIEEARVRSAVALGARTEPVKERQRAIAALDSALRSLQAAGEEQSEAFKTGKEWRRVLGDVECNKTKNCELTK